MATPIRSLRQVRTVPNRAILSLILVAGALTLYAEELATSAVPTRSVVWGSLALAAYVGGLLCLLGARQGNGLGLAKWKLGSLFLVWYGLTFGLATVTWSRPQPSTAGEIALRSVLRALWLIAVGMTSWTIGYFVGPNKLLQRPVGHGMRALRNRCTETVRSPLTPWTLYVIGLAARIGSAATTGRFGYVGNPASALSTATGYGQILTEISLFCPLGVCAAALRAYREGRPGARITLAVLFVAEIAFGAAQGGKDSFIIAALAAVIPMSSARYRIPKTAVITGALLFMMIVIPFNIAYRSAVRGGSNLLSTSQAIDKAPTIFRQTVTGQSLLTALPTSTRYLLERLQEIDGPAIVMQRTPGQIAFSPPFQLIEGPLIGIVPRAIWPGKPILAPGYEFSQQYYEIPANIYTASAITPIGDLYRHGGWLPVIIGMFVCGFGLRLLDDNLDIHAEPYAIFLILLLFPDVVTGENDWTSFLALIPATVATWLLATVLAFRTRRTA